MAIDFDQKIIYITPNNTINNFHYLYPLPDKCPICSFSISPEYFLIYLKTSINEVLCGCPRNECGSLFFAKYKVDYDYNETEFKGYFPLSKAKKEFPEEVVDLSSNFESIYNQAHHAEQEGLDLICGVAYRKALEYLIKDYILKINNEDENRVKRMPLQQCIQQFITEPTIRQMAERATWLGNDETHYVRKWEDKDVQDLKNLIDLTVYFISMNIKASRYLSEMNR
ncbi:hypothetical protein ABEY24_20685 [Peribacillus frigoritolerans]|uniref:hypothetical protein n=1 Tax=Peribacillus frigoritolerans TaxID=450367 RepID=UPI003D2A8DCC